ncbi:unnamed protein product [Brachionus calyciflorus]|uniref:Large ribosomal subunit protein mL50 n=1 Tax=Brachionus calyciflorus TaxID=104777 RepID=A0A813S7F7_9BILA|nr:unnamed protein product [Brachionus calyciflorus]
MHYLFSVFTVFLGCCSNVFFLELLTNVHPGSGNIITLAQFLFISIKGFIFEHRFGTKKSIIPLRKYMTLVIMFFVVSVVNNYALNFNISMPLHMIFRSGSLIANMVLGIIILNKRYNLREYISIVFITIGIIICTLASSTDIKKPNVHGHVSNDFVDFLWWVVGILMLTFALLLSAGMGIIQEGLYKTHGKHPSEALYYNHVLTLPAFVFLYNDISNHVTLFNASQPYYLVLFSLPVMWLYLIGNTLTQYVCISSVFVLTTECASLTVTLVLTLRKFASLIISIIYFKNPFTVWHWIGTIFVFAGTLMFTNIIKIINDRMISLLKISRVYFLILKNNSELTLKSSRGLASFKNLFGSNETKESSVLQNKNDNLISTDFEAIKKVETTRLVRVKAYKPPTNVEELIKNMCKESYGQNFNEQNYRELSLADPKIKFNLLTKCISTFNHNIPNASLNDIKNVNDLISFYSTELKDTNPLEDLYQQPDLPKNLHINLEYNRFEPEKDTFFDGRDAFPERNTVVTSLWYSKKYKSVYKKKPVFTK